MTNYNKAQPFKAILCLLSAAALTLAVPIGAAPATMAPANGKAIKDSGDFRDVAKTAIPAVVSIKVKGKSKAVNSFFGNSDDDDDNKNPLNDEFWQRFFGMPRPGNAEQQPISGQASGFIISSDGYIVTNSHVVNDMTDISVTLNNGKEFPAKVIGSDSNSDIALIKIDAKDLPFLKFGDSDDLEVGQWVVAIGNPMGLQASLTVGVVSAKGRNNLDLTRIEDYIQTDAAINRGNSGGPLLNLNSEVVGMNTAIVTTMATGGYMGIGFAIPSNLLKAVLADLEHDGSFKRGFLGVTLQPVDDNLAQAFGLDKAEGALIAEVAKDSPAEKGGIKQGDIIIKYNQQPVTNIGALRNAVSMMKPGSKIVLSILRNGKPIELTLDIGLFPSSETVASAANTENKLGLQVVNLTPELSAQLGYTSDKGVLITGVNTSGPAAWAGIRKGSLILEVNKKKVTSVDEFNTALNQNEAGKPILLLIKQGDLTRFVSFKLG